MSISICGHLTSCKIWTPLDNFCLHMPICRLSSCSHLWNLLSGSKELHIIVFSICIVLELIFLSELFPYPLSHFSLYTFVQSMGMWEEQSTVLVPGNILPSKEDMACSCSSSCTMFSGAEGSCWKKISWEKGQAGSWQSLPAGWAGCQKLCSRGRQKRWVSLHFFRGFLDKGGPSSYH